MTLLAMMRWNSLFMLAGTFALCQPSSFVIPDLGRVDGVIRGGILAADGRSLFTWGSALREWDVTDGKTRKPLLLRPESFGEGGCFADVSGGGRRGIVLEQLPGDDAAALGRLVWLEAPDWRPHVIDSGIDMSECVETNLLGHRGILMVQRHAQVRFYPYPLSTNGQSEYQEVYSFYTPSRQAGLLQKLREFTVIPFGEKEDTMRRRELIHVGPEGMAIDRKTYQDNWFKRIQELRDTDPAVRRIMAGESLAENEWEELAHKLNAPEFWFDEPALRKAFEQPSGSLSDFIRAALGLYELPTRQQRVERAFNVWVAENSSSINPDQAHLLSLLRNVVSAAVTETQNVPLDPSIFTRPPFTFQGGRARAEALFGRDELAKIMQELNDLIAAA